MQQSRQFRWGVFLENGSEMLGCACYWTGGLVERVIHWPTAHRPPAEVRVQWPEERRAKEEAAWQELVAIDAAYWGELRHMGGEVHAGTLSAEQLEDLPRVRKNARRRYEHIAYQETERAKRRRGKERHAEREARHAAKVAWETAGSICAMCGEPVGVGETYDMSFDLREDRDDFTNPWPPVFGHIRCARASVLSLFEWRLNEGDTDWQRAGYDSEDEWRCVICGQAASGSVSVTREKALMDITPLCPEHLTRENALRILEGFLPGHGIGMHNSP